MSIYDPWLKYQRDRQRSQRRLLYLLIGCAVAWLVIILVEVAR